MKQQKDEKISWKGLEEKTYNDLGFDGNAFKPEDLFNDNREDDALYLQEYDILLDTGNPKKSVNYGVIDPEARHI
jgi:hypothetical protein